MKTTCMMVSILISLVWLATASAMDVKLQWDPNTETDLAGYKVYYGTDVFTGPIQLDVANQTVATVSGLDPAQNYSFAVVAYNTSGLESSYSNIVTVPGATSLTTAVTAPANSATVSGTVSITASASDAVGVTKVEFYVNNTLQATDTATPYVYSWNTSALTSGTYSLMTKAYNSAGNVSQSGNVTVSIVNDTAAPAVSLTAPGNNTVLSGTVAITAGASDSVGVSKVEFYSNGTLLFAGNVSPYTYSWNTTSVANGSYTLTAKAYDNAGNIGQSSTVSITVLNGATIPPTSDKTAPVINAFVMPSTASSLTVAVTSFTASDAVGVTSYLITENLVTPAVNAAGWTASAPSSFTFSAAGGRIAVAWAKDAAGNISSARIVFVSMTLPVVPPSLTINDALTALQVVVGKVQPSTDQRTRLDVAPYVNGNSQPDGKIDIGDVIVILGKVTGKVVL